jgi:hypothetical protein
MKPCLFLLISLLLAGCAAAPVAPPAELFSDQLFRPPSERIAAGDIFAVSDEMKRFVRAELSGSHGGGIQQRFAEGALHQRRAAARIRVRPDEERRRSVRRPDGKLPFARDHDRGAREGDRALPSAFSASL